MCSCSFLDRAATKRPGLAGDAYERWLYTVTQVRLFKLLACPTAGGWTLLTSLPVYIIFWHADDVCLWCCLFQWGS